MDEREQLVTVLFHLGLSQKDIVIALSTFGYIVSGRHLRRILSSLALRRRSYSDIADVIMFIEEEMKSSGSLHGYRWMHQKCQEAGFCVRRRDVEVILKHLDPIGTELR